MYDVLVMRRMHYLSALFLVALTLVTPAGEACSALVQSAMACRTMGVPSERESEAAIAQARASEAQTSHCSQNSDPVSHESETPAVPPALGSAGTPGAELDCCLQTIPGQAEVPLKAADGSASVERSAGGSALVLEEPRAGAGDARAHAPPRLRQERLALLSSYLI